MSAVALPRAALLTMFLVLALPGVGSFAVSPLGVSRAARAVLEASLASFPRTQILTPSLRERTAHVMCTAMRPIEVWDGVLPEGIAQGLGDYGPGVYRRWLEAQPDSLSPVEVFIESVLEATGDTESQEVEWWGREAWLPVESHRDTDEPAAEAGCIRFPSRVYIAYLDIDPAITAPTVLWTPQNEEQEARLWAVPAVSGRLLSFQGDLLHGVPRSACQFLGEVDPAPERALQRHVLILNAWHDFAPDDDDAFEESDDAEEGEQLEEGLDEQSAGGNEGVRDGRVRVRAGVLSLALALSQRYAGSPTPESGAGAGAVDSEMGAEDAAACEFSIPTFGSDEPFVTRVAASSAAVARMFNAKEAVGWLRIDSGGGREEDLTVGVPSELGTREERTKGVVE